MAKSPNTTANPNQSNSRLFLLGIIALVVVGLGAVAVIASGRDGNLAETDGAEIGTVEVAGDALAALPQGVQVGDAATDPMVGQVAPTLTGTAFDGSEVVIGPDGTAKVIYFLAHWCPHCQDEVPVIQDLIDAGKQPDGLEIYAVSTSVNSGQANYPPSAWLAREEFTPITMRDDEVSTAIASMGGSSFPFAVYLDADNRVVARSAGNLDAATTEQLWQDTAP